MPGNITAQEKGDSQPATRPRTRRVKHNPLSTNAGTSHCVIPSTTHTHYAQMSQYR